MDIPVVLNDTSPPNTAINSSTRPRRHSGIRLTARNILLTLPLPMFLRPRPIRAVVTVETSPLLRTATEVARALEPALDLSPGLARLVRTAKELVASEGMRTIMRMVDQVMRVEVPADLSMKQRGIRTIMKAREHVRERGRVLLLVLELPLKVLADDGLKLRPLAVCVERMASLLPPRMRLPLRTPLIMVICHRRSPHMHLHLPMPPHLGAVLQEALGQRNGAIFLVKSPSF